MEIHILFLGRQPRRGSDFFSIESVLVYAIGISSVLSWPFQLETNNLFYIFYDSSFVLCRFAHTEQCLFRSNFWYCIFMNKYENLVNFQLNSVPHIIATVLIGWFIDVTSEPILGINHSSTIQSQIHKFIIIDKHLWALTLESNPSQRFFFLGWFWLFWFCFVKRKVAT